jgi:myo-inositol-1(or 4)-monophosphatase
MHPMLNTAIKAARRAGSVIQRGARDLDRLTVLTKGPKDFVSEVDRTAEATIVDTLLEAYPDHGILAEEGTVNSKVTNPDNIWIIDPLDGTTNFLHGYPQYCVSIALQHKGVMTQAVVYDPTRNDLFTATRGAGAFLNDRRLRVSKREKFEECLISTGFPFKDGSMVETYLAMMREMIHKTAGLRRAGAAALDLAHVAAGWYDGFWEIGLNPWDMAAGTLLITEAGGLVTDLYGEENWLQSGQIIAASPRVLPHMLQALSPHMLKARARAATIEGAQKP